MAYRVLDGCICCEACVATCPNEAISLDGGTYVIDPTRCTECVGAFETSQCQEYCPVDCIGPDPDWVETREALAAKYRALHPA